MTGVHYEDLTLPDETHDIFRYANNVAMNRAVVEFFEHYLAAETH
jgi:hypothetical protein